MMGRFCGFLLNFFPVVMFNFYKHIWDTTHRRLCNNSIGPIYDA